MRGSVVMQMAASPETVWSLVTDVTRIGEFSPETFGAEWIRGSTGPAVGARFRGHVKRNGRGPVYWTQCKVVRCEPTTDFAFTVVGPGDFSINTWGYHIEPKGGGSEVTEWFELSNMWILRLYWKVAGTLRGRTNDNGMRTTLERIKAVVEAPAAP